GRWVEADPGLSEGAGACGGIGQIVAVADRGVLRWRFCVLDRHCLIAGCSETQELPDGENRSGDAHQDADVYAPWRLDRRRDREDGARLRRTVFAGGGADGQAVLQVISELLGQPAANLAAGCSAFQARGDLERRLTR